MEEAHTNNGGYELEGVIWHQHSNRLLIKIMELFDKNIPVIDIGCGHNFYMSILKYAGYSALGIDNTDLGSMYFMKADVTKPLEMLAAKNVRNTISLEVGEHIPSELSNGYLDNICKFKGDVILSWAVPGQAGIGHINCQTNEWVATEMLKRGYMIDAKRTLELRESVKDCHCSWFKNTLMYFTPCE